MSYENSEISEIYSTQGESKAEISTNKKVEATPTRFWKWFTESDFDVLSEIDSGHFGTVKKARLKDEATLKRNGRPTSHATTLIAVKYPKFGKEKDFYMTFHKLSHEVSCTLITHPSLVEYIGGMQLWNPLRIGVLMEFVDTNLRKAIETFPQLKIFESQLSVAKQIASGMKFLHTLKPFILHRDLRTPNVLISASLHCKIADFGLSDNLSYSALQNHALYTNLVPPECKRGRNFTKAGDVYFFGWMLVELFIGSSPSVYHWDPNIQESVPEKVRRLISLTLYDDETKRPDFRTLVSEFDLLLQITNNIELMCDDLHHLKQYIQTLGKEEAIKQVDKFGRNLFHQCSLAGNLEGIQYLVQEYGKDYLFSTDIHGNTCAHFAARSGYLHILKYLDTYKLSFDRNEDRFDLSPLTLALAMKHFDSVDFLAERVSQESLDAGLISGCSEGFLDVAKLFVAKGANVQCRDKELQMTPLIWASHNGHLKIVEWLLEQGANVNKTRPSNNATPLFGAADNGHTGVVDLLLNKGADLTICNDQGISPLWIAAQNGHRDTVALLIERGAQIDKAKNDGATPIFVAAQSGAYDVVELLLKKGAQVDSAKNDGVTPLIVSSEMGNIEVVTLLLSKGADVNKVRTTDGLSSIYVASSTGHKSIVELLLKHGARADHALFNGRTPLAVATQNGFVGIINLLLQYGADPSIAKSYSRDPAILRILEEKEKEIAKKK